MNRSLQLALYSVAGLAVLNLAVGYFTSTARTGRVRSPGENKLLDFNDALIRYNPLARLFPQASGPAVAAVPLTSQTFAPTPAPVVTDTDIGTTTYWG